ncbi:MAG TPA: prepilin-type N-terminal cleavage/methylation domain-containing protein [Patescibacteria group bacterium]|nr:prepilin-type N-terminal cleavage/methylation domain-containing protein [Patescibacteria group bacterium]
MKLRNLHKSTKGFTIVELMIATSVFAFILLVVTFGMLQVGRTYYKGITVSRTQTAARGIIDQISQGIQFSGGPVTTTDGQDNLDGTTYAFCINNTRFTYVLGQEVVDGNPVSGLHQTNHGLVVDTVPSNCNSLGPSHNTLTTVTATGLAAGETELLGPFMRLAKLDVENDPSDPTNHTLYDITIRVVYGDDDLLCSPSGGDCSDPMATPSPNSADATCKGVIGGQFCAVSELSTVVEKRRQ